MAEACAAPDQQKKRGDSETVQIRRTMDKVLGAACLLVITLVGVVWAITWGSTRGEVRDVREDVLKRDEAQWLIIRNLDGYQKETDRKVTTLEAQQGENSRVFIRIEQRQGETDRKVDKLSDKLDLILREVRK